MNLKDLLLEYNQAKIINDFGQKLVNKYQTEFPNKKVTPEQVLAKIANLDTTGNKELTFWLAMNYAKDQIHRFEDIGSRAVPNLEKFKVLLRKPNLNPKLPTRDINQIQGLPELEKIIDLYEPKQTDYLFWQKYTTLFLGRTTLRPFWFLEQLLLHLCLYRLTQPVLF